MLLPVVAGQSGNAGSQALAVTIRGLALKEIGMREWRKVLNKELKRGQPDDELESDAPPPVPLKSIIRQRKAGAFLLCAMFSMSALTTLVAMTGVYGSCLAQDRTSAKVGPGTR